MSKLPNRIDIENKEWLTAYEHFRLRLQQRYYIDITLAEYVLLCNESVKKIFNDGNKVFIGWVTFKGKEILVCKERKKPKRLRTALKTKQRIFKRHAKTTSSTDQSEHRDNGPEGL